jgi:RNA polymerase sigma factor (sigma-70 family)
VSPRILGAWFRRLQQEARRRGVPSHDAADVAQNSSLRLVKALPWLQQVDSLDAAAMKVLQNEAFRAMKAERRRRQALASFGESPPDDHGLGAETWLRHREQRALLARLLVRLSKTDRRLLIWHDLQEKPLPEVAARLGLKPDTVKKQHLRARARLAEKAEEHRLAEQTERRDWLPLLVPVPLWLEQDRSWREVWSETWKNLGGQSALVLFCGALFVGVGPSERTALSLPPTSAQAQLAQGATPSHPTPPSAEWVACETGALGALGPISVFPVTSSPSLGAPSAGAPRASGDAKPPGLPRNAAARIAISERTPSSPSGDATAATSPPGAAAAEVPSAFEKSLIAGVQAAIASDTQEGYIEALRLLDQHGREFPGGQLAPEREEIWAALRSKANRGAPAP